MDSLQKLGKRGERGKRGHISREEQKKRKNSIKCVISKLCDRKRGYRQGCGQLSMKRGDSDEKKRRITTYPDSLTRQGRENAK